MAELAPVTSAWVCWLRHLRVAPHRTMAVMTALHAVGRQGFIVSTAGMSRPFLIACPRSPRCKPPPTHSNGRPPANRPQASPCSPARIRASRTTPNETPHPIVIRIPLSHRQSTRRKVGNCGAPSRRVDDVDARRRQASPRLHAPRSCTDLSSTTRSRRDQKNRPDRMAPVGPADVAMTRRGGAPATAYCAFFIASLRSRMVLWHSRTCGSSSCAASRAAGGVSWSAITSLNALSRRSSDSSSSAT